MRILFINICEPATYEGHKLFDINWASNLTMLGNVDIIQPSPEWYGKAPANVNTITYDYYLNNRFSFLNKGIFNKGLLRRLDCYHRFLDLIMILFSVNLDKKKKYDIIISSHMDYIALWLIPKHSAFLKKLYILEHTPTVYANKVVDFFARKHKNHVHHLIMEKIAIPFYIKQAHIKEELCHYTPHPLNTVHQNDLNSFPQYDVVGISNSNCESMIRDLVSFENSTHYFMLNNIKIIIRSHKIEYNDGYLRVFAKRLGLKQEEYYSYIKSAKVILSIFPEDFGARTSGTIIDALSNSKPILGSEYETMVFYHQSYPNACKTYKTINQFVSQLTYLLMEDKSAVKEECDLFCRERSGMHLKKVLEDAFTEHMTFHKIETIDNEKQ